MKPTKILEEKTSEITEGKYEDETIFSKLLLRFYDSHRRVLPWREEPTPYRVWVSEIMLQQTRVETVLPYFDRFVSVLPDVEGLAECDEETLLKLWEGLGYYRRVRNMQKAARILVEEHGGKIPSKKAELIRLPGIGEYTAGAIASIAFGEREVAVDGNVLRVMSRVLAAAGDVTKQPLRSRLAEEVQRRQDPCRPGDFNQALMDVGATICLPNGDPLCEECPFKELCLARSRGEQMLYPQKLPKKERRVEERTLLLIVTENTLALQRRTGAGVLKGLWEFPALERKAGPKEIEAYVLERGMQIEEIQSLPSAKHIFSHLEWHMEAYAVRVRNEILLRETTAEGETLIWATPEDIIAKYSLPSAFKVYKKMIERGEIPWI